MVKSKTLIEKQARRKTNSQLVETIRSAKKGSAWVEVAGALSRPRRKRLGLNLNELEKLIEDGKTNVVVGKILSQGSLNKKVKIVAIGFSEKAKEKLLKAGSSISYIDEEIKSNPSAKDIKIIK